MELLLIRKFFKETYTVGRLYYDNVFACNTLEDRIRDLQDRNHDGDFDDEGEGKLYGMTAIPCGRYEVIVNYSQKLKRVLPLLLDVPGFTGIRIHAGRNERHTLGCILVGDNKAKGSLENGPYWETFVKNMIEEDLLKGNKCYISIKE